MSSNKLTPQTTFRHVEDTREKPMQYFKRDGKTYPVSPIRHSVWRCDRCRSLAVGPFKAPLPAKCMKCH